MQSEYNEEDTQEFQQPEELLEPQEEAAPETDRVAVNPKTGKRLTVGPGESLPNGWHWA